MFDGNNNIVDVKILKSLLQTIWKNWIFSSNLKATVLHDRSTLFWLFTATVRCRSEIPQTPYRQSMYECVNLILSSIQIITITRNNVYEAYS